MLESGVRLKIPDNYQSNSEYILRNFEPSDQAFQEIRRLAHTLKCCGEFTFRPNEYQRISIDPETVIVQYGHIQLIFFTDIPKNSFCTLRTVVEY